VEKTTYEGNTYIVMLINRSDSPLMGHQLLMFRVEDDEIYLLPHPIQTEGIGYIMVFVDGFADRNGNGYPDLAIDTGTGGSHPTLYLVLLELRPHGEVEDISPQSSDALPRYLVDLDGDGIFEIEARGCIPHPFNGYCLDRYFGFRRLFAWDGTAYRDISATNEAYWPAIAAFWRGTREREGCLLPDYPMYDMLVGYLAMGRLQEGWSRLHPLLRWDTCSQDSFARYSKDMIDLVAWVGTHLAGNNPRQQ
jgi:hypothetical protein